MPKSLGGLGSHKLCMLNTALCTRWLWLHKTDAFKPWHGMDILASEHPLALFHASVSILVGQGTSVLFWEDAWISGLTASTITPC
jgi:hypothetical protein